MRERWGPATNETGPGECRGRCLTCPSCHCVNRRLPEGSAGGYRCALSAKFAVPFVLLCVAVAAVPLCRHVADHGPTSGVVSSPADEDPELPEAHVARALEWERTAAVMSHDGIGKMDLARAADEWAAAAQGFDREGRDVEEIDARERAKAVKVGEGR